MVRFLVPLYNLCYNRILYSTNKQNRMGFSGLLNFTKQFEKYPKRKWCQNSNILHRDLFALFRLFWFGSVWFGFQFGLASVEFISFSLFLFSFSLKHTQLHLCLHLHLDCICSRFLKSFCQIYTLFYRKNTHTLIDKPTNRHTQSAYSSLFFYCQVAAMLNWFGCHKKKKYCVLFNAKAPSLPRYIGWTHIKKQQPSKKKGQRRGRRRKREIKLSTL